MPRLRPASSSVSHYPVDGGRRQREDLVGNETSTKVGKRSLSVLG